MQKPTEKPLKVYPRDRYRSNIKKEHRRAIVTHVGGGGGVLTSVLQAPSRGRKPAPSLPHTGLSAPPSEPQTSALLSHPIARALPEERESLISEYSTYLICTCNILRPKSIQIN